MKNRIYSGTCFFIYVSMLAHPLFAQGIAAADFTVCAITPSGGLKCWGNNNLGQLGIGKKKAPKQCCGFAFYTDTPLDVLGLVTGVKAVAAGIWHLCAVTQQGGVKCWGENIHGNLGIGIDNGPEQCPTTSGEVVYCSTKPVDVKGLSSGVLSLALGKEFSCALTSAGTVKCWGLNMHGQLGNTSASVKWEGKTQYTNSFLPVSVEGLSGVKAVTAGANHVCALTSSGGVKCWGSNTEGQLGTGDASGPEQCYNYACSVKPVSVKGLSSGVKSIASGFNHTCALTSSGTVKCWGSNVSHELGIGMVTSPSGCDKTEETPYYDESRGEEVTGYKCLYSSSAAEIKELSGVKSIYAGVWGNCTVTGEGKVLCWGSLSGQKPPIEIEGLPGEDVQRISIGWSGFACALLSNGSIKCWGNNVYNNLGNGKIESAPNDSMFVPVDVISFP